MANPELGIGTEDKPKISKSRLVFRVASSALGVGGAVAAGVGLYDTYHHVRPERSALHRQVDAEYPRPSHDALEVSLDQIAQFRMDTNTALDNHDYGSYWQLVASQEDTQRAAQEVVNKADVNQSQYEAVKDKSGLYNRQTKDLIAGLGGAYAAALGVLGFGMSVITPIRKTDSRRQLVPDTTR